MKGWVDDEDRALVKVVVGLPDGDTNAEVTVWIDTAFNGSLVLPEHVVDDLGLPQQSIAEAILADGRKVELATFGCGISFFGKPYVSQITTNASKCGLLDTAMLKNRSLMVDYKTKRVTIE